METEQLMPLMRLVYQKTGNTYIVLSTTVQVRVGLPTPPEVQAWNEAYAEVERTCAVYNKALIEAQARWNKWPNTFGTNPPYKEFQAYTDAGNKAHRLVQPMLKAMAAQQQRPHASWVPGVLYADELSRDLYTRPLDQFSGFETTQNQSVAVKFLPLVVQLGSITGNNRSQEDDGHDDGY